MKNGKRILSITIRRMVDDSPDTSYLGTYGPSAESEFAINREHTLECAVNSGATVTDYVNTHDWSETEGRCLVCGAVTTSEPCPEYSGNPQCTCDGISTAAGEYAYFNPGSIEAFDIKASWIPASIRGEKRRRVYWHKTTRNNAQSDYKRIEAYYRGEFFYIGIVVTAEIQLVPNGPSQTFTSGGLWGIESDSGDDYFAEVEGEELHDLKGQLEALGFSKRAIAVACKNVLHKEG